MVNESLRDVLRGHLLTEGSSLQDGDSNQIRRAVAARKMILSGKVK